MPPGNQNTVQHAADAAGEQGKRNETSRVQQGGIVGRNEMRGYQPGQDPRQIGQCDARQVDAAVSGNHRQHDTQRQQSQFRQLRRHRLEVVGADKIGARQGDGQHEAEEVGQCQKDKLAVGQKSGGQIACSAVSAIAGIVAGGAVCCFGFSFHALIDEPVVRLGGNASDRKAIYVESGSQFNRSSRALREIGKNSPQWPLPFFFDVACCGALPVSAAYEKIALNF